MALWPKNTCHTEITINANNEWRQFHIPQSTEINHNVKYFVFDSKTIYKHVSKRIEVIKFNDMYT